MSEPVRAIRDGLSAAGMHWPLVATVLFILLTGFLLLYALLRRIFGDRFSTEEFVSLSLGGWLLPAFAFALLWYAGARLFSMQLGMLAGTILPVLAALALLARPAKSNGKYSGAAVLSLFLLAGLLILLRLAFLAEAVVPLYFDSAEHYRLIRELVTGLNRPGAETGLAANYYHRGFHVLAAFLTSLTGAQITDTMLVLGQVVLALMPFPVFFIVRHWTGSNSAAFFALLLSAFGWSMPAHAVAWGKYPALASLALVPFAGSLAYLAVQHRNDLPKKKDLGLLVLVIAGALVSILFHSRSLALYALLALAWPATRAWIRMAQRAQLLVFGLLVLGVPAALSLVPGRGILLPLVDAYGRSAILITACVILLSIFAWRVSPGLVFFLFVSASLVIAGLFIPLVDLLPGYANTALLDRPYAQILLYLPLSLVGGFGLAGLEQALQGRELIRGNFRWRPGAVTGALFITIVIVNALFQYDLYPDDCCDIASADDLAAIHWIDRNLPSEALILTASTELNVLPTGEFQGIAGGDGGTWITPLTGRPVVSMPYNTDFGRPQTLATLCQMQVDYVYVGYTGWYFDDAAMSARPDGYRLLLVLPKARVYEVTGCK